MWTLLAGLLTQAKNREDSYKEWSGVVKESKSYDNTFILCAMGNLYMIQFQNIANRLTSLFGGEEWGGEKFKIVQKNSKVE